MLLIHVALQRRLVTFRYKYILCQYDYAACLSINSHVHIMKQNFELVHVKQKEKRH